MTNAEINIAIAESVGWHPHPDNDKREQKFWTYGGTSYGLPNGKPKRIAMMPCVYDPDFSWTKYESLPNYSKDLNAMHEAEELFYAKEDTIEGAERMRDYSKWLCHLTKYPLRATADQRAEAFLKTIGKWKKMT